MKCSQFYLPSLVMALTLVAPLALGATSADEAESSLDELGDTRVARWRGNADAAFMLFFDDGWPSHWQEAIPALRKRGLTGSFYPNFAKGEFKKFRERWEAIAAEGDMTFGNHTMTHKGFTDLEGARYEIGEATRETRAMMPTREPEMISFAKPGGLPADRWPLTEEQREALCDEFALVQRPTFRGHGAFFHLKTVEDHTALIDRALQTGEAEYITFHGIERGPDYPWSYEDFWPLPLDVFHPVLDRIAEHQDRGELWVTDHISCLLYRHRADAAKVDVRAATPDQIEVILTTNANPTPPDATLTLVTRVPPSWSRCNVTQGDTNMTVDIIKGLAIYNARLNGQAIILRAGSDSSSERDQ